MSEEIWRQIILQDRETGYEISSRGSVRDGRGKLCKFNVSDGYYTFVFKHHIEHIAFGCGLGNVQQRDYIEHLSLRNWTCTPMCSSTHFSPWARLSV